MKDVVVAVGLVWLVSLTFFLNFVVAETQQSKITNMTSNLAVHYAMPTLNPSLLYAHSSILSPIEQVQAGIPAKDVKCADGLTLVIKAEDGSPACIKPDTAQKLVERGWAKEPVPYVTLDDQSGCKGTEVPSGEFKNRIFPVLMMPTNSTATVCVTYKFESGWQSYPNKDLYPRGILDTCCFISMGLNTNHSVSSNKFEVLANPSLFNMTNTYNGSKISVIYKIHAKSDSKGFYDTSVPFDGCLSYPLAVGYDASEVSATKFHADFSIPCFNTIEEVYSVKILSGMTYKEVQFRDYP